MVSVSKFFTAGLAVGGAVIGQAAGLPVFSEQPTSGKLPQSGGLKNLALEHQPGNVNRNLVAGRSAVITAPQGFEGPSHWMGTSEARTLTQLTEPANLRNGGRRLMGLTPFGGGGTPTTTPPSPTTPPSKAPTSAPPSPGCGTLNPPVPSPTPGASGSLVSTQLTGCPMSDYSAPVNVGGQSFMAIADTGSTTFAVAANTCTDCDVSPLYKPGSSSKDDKKKIEADYGKGKWLGELTTDTVAFANGPSASIAFGAIYDQSDWFNGNGCDLTSNEAGPSINQAIMGLAGTDLLINGTESWLAKTNSSFAVPAVTFGLCDQNGGIYLGGYPKNNAASDLVFTPMATLKQSAYIAVAMEFLGVNGTDVGATLNDFGYTIVDTGTTAIFLPPSVFASTTDLISQQTNGAITADFFNNGKCIQLSDTTAADVNNQAPPLTYYFLNPANSSTYQTVTNGAINSYLIVQSDGEGGVIVCPDMFSSGSDNPQTLLGNTIMRNFLTIFDYKNQQVGFSVSQGICK